MATLGSKSVGSVVTLNVNRTATDFIVVHQGLPSSSYHSSCNGTWLLMKKLYCNSQVYGSYSNNNYASSSIHNYLNNTFYNLFNNNTKDLIKQVRIPYTKGTGPSGSLCTGSSGLSTKIFLLSRRELVVAGSNEWLDTVSNNEGATLSYFADNTNSKRIAYYGSSKKGYITRSPATDGDTGFMRITDKGADGGTNGSSSNIDFNYIRPALIMASDVEVDDSGNVVISSFSGYANIGGVNKELSGGYANIGGVWKELSDAYVNINGVWKPTA